MYLQDFALNNLQGGDMPKNQTNLRNFLFSYK